jgi:DNA replication protein DnaC
MDKMESVGDVIKRVGDVRLLNKNMPEKTTSVPELPVPPTEYKCHVCQDTGYVHPLRENGKVDYSKVVDCRCVRDDMEKKRLSWMVDRCEIPPKGYQMTFANLKVVPAISKAVRIAKEIVEDRGPIFFTLMGQTSTGKTHLAIAIIHEWLALGKPAKYAYVPLLLKELRDGFKNRSDDYSYQRRYDFYLNVPMLLLDDLGTESDTAWAQEHLDTIIDYRLMHNLRTLVTTNKTREEVGFRIMARLERNGTILVFDQVPKYVR